MATEPLLVIEGLSKVFHRRVLRGPHADLIAVDGIDLRVCRGDVFGFLGPNGAGKSTTLRMALGLIHPTGGRVTIGGYDVATQRLDALRKVGAFVEAPSFYPYLSGRKNLEIFAGLSGGVSRDDLDEALRRVGLLGREHDPVKVYSHGMRQRLGIAACLLPRPELLLLDEPTDGLDPHGIHEVRELIKRLARDEGLTVFLSSHLLGEVENLCNRIAVLEKGRVILQGRLDELEAEHRRHRIVVDDAPRAMDLLRERFKLEARVAGDGLDVLLGAVPGHEVVAALAGAGLRVELFARETAWLDRLFLERTSTNESNLAEAREAKT